MGVMSCSRSHCDQIMCSTYVQSIGYVCRECQDEFQEYLISKNVNPNNEALIRNQLELFMDTRKGTFVTTDEITVAEFFNKHSR